MRSDGIPQSLDDLIRLAGDVAIKRLAESHAAGRVSGEDSDPNRRETEADGYRAEALRRKKIQTQAKALRKTTSIMLFNVDDQGYLSAANFNLVETRAEVYDEIPTDWHKTANHFLAAVAKCRALDAYVHSLYSEAHCSSDMESALDKTALLQQPRSPKDSLHEMHRDTEISERSWIRSMSTEEFDNFIVAPITVWLSEEPNWWEEYEYIPLKKTAEGFAFQYFRDDVPLQVKDRLHISLYEGDRPGSNLRLAVLKISVSEANSRAEAEGLSIRFQSRPD